MISLQKGIQIVRDSNSLARESRAMLSSGISRTSEQLRRTVRYRDDAFVPVEPWREPNLTEYSILSVNSHSPDLDSWNIGSSIGIVRVPDSVLAPLENLGVSSISTSEDYHALIQHPEYSDAVAQIIGYFKPFCVSRGGFQVLGTDMQKAGLETATFDPKENCYVGLHLDSWDRLPLTQRNEARNRICINLGRDDRFLLFINLTLIDMFKVFKPEDIRSHYDLGEKFMKYYPAYPVVKLKISPKEAYIAPTENMIHDACTIGMKRPDISFTLLGHFGITC